jgi:DNA invertase Pin-like site-specific DNA recombinase
MQHGLPEPEVIADQISGTVPLFDRKDGNVFEFYLEKGDVVIASALDRLFRSSLDGQQTIDVWRKLGVKLIIAGFGDLNDTNNPLGKLMFDMVLSFASFERELICKRLHEGRKAKRAKGGFIGGEPPWGHYVVGEGKKAQLRQKDWYPMAVRRMREFREGLGWTYDKIVVKMNDIEMFDPISRNTVRRIMVDEKGKWMPAIGKEKFVMTHQVKESITKRRARGGYR